MHDYVIVGAGSAGCVLAARLTEDPDVSVLLVEAGPPDTADFVHITAAFSALFRTQHDWDHMTAWEPECLNRRIYLRRGRMLGGSSSMNAMIYIRGNRADYDEWVAQGATGWGYDDLLPYFRRAEDNERGENEFHGVGGPLPVSEGRARSALCAAFLEAADAYGLAPNPDFNGREQDGVGWYQVTQRGGRRASAAVAYLHPAMGRPNLEVQTHCQALKVLVEGGRAVGVQVARAGEVLELRAAREVIVSGGAYNSPQLLMLSGIGRPEELALLQIPVVADAPAVGANLPYHPTVGVSYASEEECSLKDALNESNLAQWMEGQGPVTSNVAESGGFVRTRDDIDAPDVQFHMVAAIYHQEGLLAPPAHGFTLSACVLKPRSRGIVALPSPDPTAKPFIVHNYLSDPEDLRSAMDGLRMTMELARTEPLARYAQTPFMTPASDSDADVEAHRAAPSRRSTTRWARAGWAPTRRRWSTRSCACAASRRCAGGRVGNADRPAWEHKCADDRARRARGRPDPRAGRRAGGRRGGGRRGVATTRRAAPGVASPWPTAGVPGISPSRRRFGTDRTRC